MQNVLIEAGSILKNDI